MATYLIQNGVNKRNTTWANQNSKQSASTYAGESATITWNQNGYLQITTFINGYKSNLSGWNAKYDASAYAYLYVECKTDGLNSGYGNARLVVTQYGNDDDTGIQTAMSSPSTLATYKINLSSLSSTAKANLQVYLYYRDYRTGNAVMNRSGYIKNMWLTSNYTITYNANGGSGAPAAQTFEEGSRTLSSTAPTRSGYSFLGWSTSSSATSATYSAGGTISLSSNVTLYAVWKAELSTVSASNGTIGTSQNITITQQGTSYSYKHTLKYTVNGTTGTIASNITGSSATITQAWTPPASIVPLYTDRKTYPCTITCETYSGSTKLGEKTVSITLTVPNSYAPDLSGSVTRTSGTYPSSFSEWVKGETTPYFSYTASPKQNASITKWEFTVNGVTTSQTSSATSKTFTGSAVTSGTLKVKVTDSRGLTKEVSTSITVTDYSAPTVTNLVMARADSGGTLSAQGEYLKVTADIAITSLSNTNTKTWRIQYREKDALSWIIDDSGTFTGYTESFSWVSSTDIMDESKTYETRLVITDYYGNVIATSTVSTALSIIDIKANGLGVAFGKVHEESDNNVVVAYDWGLIRPVPSIGNEIINGFLTLTNGSTSGGASTLPTFGTWLILCMNTNVEARTGLFLYNTSSTLGYAIKIAGASDITITASGKDISVKTGAGTCYTFAIKLSSKT